MPRRDPRRRRAWIRLFPYVLKVYGDRTAPGFAHAIHHSPMRRSARDVLHHAKGEYDAGHRPGGGGDLEDRREPPLRPARTVD